MKEKHKGKAEFFILYIREAHPDDGWQVPPNERDGIRIDEPKTEEERKKAASACAKGLKVTIPMLVDNMENTTEKAYAGWPDRLYVVDKEGKIAYKGDPGPKGFNPAEMEKALIKLLEESK